MLVTIMYPMNCADCGNPVFYYDTPPLYGDDIEREPITLVDGSSVGPDIMKIDCKHCRPDSPIKPIESAPTDGTHILLYGEHWDDTDERNVGWCEGYMDGCHGWYHIASLPSYPTHWMELPEVPAC